MIFRLKQSSSNPTQAGIYLPESFQELMKYIHNDLGIYSPYIIPGWTLQNDLYYELTLVNRCKPDNVLVIGNDPFADKSSEFDVRTDVLRLSFTESPSCTGGRKLNIDQVKGVIREFARLCSTQLE